MNKNLSAYILSSKIKLGLFNCNLGSCGRRARDSRVHHGSRNLASHSYIYNFGGLLPCHTQPTESRA
jgi:hypothetical protein